MNISRKSNRLIHEKSPYLLQHAYNPVDWHSWSSEAFDKATQENKPIFLSIGYSTCHWCHVMERESFEDEEVAEVLNKHYIAIKVDREERPDIDGLYMTYCQALTGQGGWPLTIIMTPDKKPFFAGTYFPKNTRMGMTGLIELLKNISLVWFNDHEKLLESSEDIIKQVNQHFFTERTGNISNQTIEKSFKTFNKIFDTKYGGFGKAPKFPTPHNLMFLLRYYKVNKDQKSLDMVTDTLKSMYKGGMFDHIGFGFSRYSTDDRWLAPHFEKMLYDNALLAVVYLEAYQITKDELFSDVARKVFTYVLEKMTSPDGGFYSAEDADSEGIEGKFYLWDQAEILNLLGIEEGTNFCKMYDITSTGNFEGKNIPNLIRVDLKDLENHDYNNMRKKLYDYREKRIPPHKDDKILTSWNGLMIAAFSYGARILNNQDYAQAAKKAADFIFTNLYQDKRLLARFREKEAKHLGYVDDYAFLIWGLIELYEANYEPHYLKKALDLNQELLKLFWDNEKGGLFFSGSDSEKLIARPKEIYNGAMPSGNSVAAYNFLKLARLTGDQELENKANQIFETFGGTVENSPTAHSFLFNALLYNISKSTEIVFMGTKEEMQQYKDTLTHNFEPFTTTHLLNNGTRESLISIAPFLENNQQVENKPTVFVCENHSCHPPLTSLEEFKSILNS
ncbi:hypothetical protein SAMN00017405_0348 [Desulfonispora thiosulfatigenes DSM 11270]|uniref:Spermatogenesis-associated protein 20-like TRX domain-containing protein n=1 Tax=Desulfonispora thiosulfatigenes DSM 11270 TaxID=656914 RepID=A0A1W1VP91_DESTI|nr:thioredoxin domain-containing protein [Desulfonispora thiosulfatigenes]SMB95192.1 hypothetical protein SAMN00017405_0348 [Desulfonispora thiosulfatigenes DSM 11270]